MNAKGKLNRTEKGAVAYGICQELSEKLAALQRKGVDIAVPLAALGFS